MLVNPKELELAKMLIRALAVPFDASKLKDGVEERLRGLIQSRADTALAAQSQGSARQRARVMDIAFLLCTWLPWRDFVAHCVARSLFLHENGIMRKRIVGSLQTQHGGHSDKRWLNLEQIATVDVTSEDPRFPIEYAFWSDDGPGWRASEPGQQQIRIIFDKPISVHHIELRFHEADRERTQEFVLRWSSESGGSATEIVRQQWNFSPAGSTTEMEQYAVNLDAVSVLELVIRPDLHRPEAVASLALWRVG